MNANLLLGNLHYLFILLGFVTAGVGALAFLYQSYVEIHRYHSKRRLDDFQNHSFLDE